MPISEDEYDSMPNQSSMSKAEQRRNNKPIMEKRRRARINHCLNELKTLILDAMKKDPARHSKLEKADILEMTVKHLQTLQRQQLAVAVATDPVVLNKFKTGFNECAGEVGRYIGNMDGVETGVKQRLAAHLSNCVTGLQQVSPFSFPGITTSSNTVTIQNPGDLNNNQNRIQVPPGIQLIPSRLPTGELALLVPNSSNIPFFNSALLGNNFVSEAQRSAFTNVKTTKSPPLSPASSTTSFEDSFQRARSPKDVQISFPTPPEQIQFRLHGQETKQSTPSSKEVLLSFQTPPDQIRVHHKEQYQTNSSPEEARALFPTPPEQYKLHQREETHFEVTANPRKVQASFPSTQFRLHQQELNQFEATGLEEVQTSFPSTPEQYKMHQNQTQQFQISSTSYSPESRPNAKIEYKAVPIYQPAERTVTTNRPFSSDLEPLSVITNKDKYQNRPRDFRKREHDDGLLTLAEASTSKYGRYSLDDVSTTSSSSGSPDHQFDSFYQQASTSGSSNCSSHRGDSNSDQNDHMWRPW